MLAHMTWNCCRNAGSTLMSFLYLRANSSRLLLKVSIISEMWARLSSATFLPTASYACGTDIGNRVITCRVPGHRARQVCGKDTAVGLWASDSKSVGRLSNNEIVERAARVLISKCTLIAIYTSSHTLYWETRSLFGMHTLDQGLWGLRPLLLPTPGSSNTEKHNWQAIPFGYYRPATRRERFAPWPSNVEIFANFSSRSFLAVPTWFDSKIHQTPAQPRCTYWTGPAALSQAYLEGTPWRAWICLHHVCYGTAILPFILYSRGRQLAPKLLMLRSEQVHPLGSLHSWWTCSKPPVVHVWRGDVSGLVARKCGGNSFRTINGKYPIFAQKWQICVLITCAHD